MSKNRSETAKEAAEARGTYKERKISQGTTLKSWREEEKRSGTKRGKMRAVDHAAVERDEMTVPVGDEV